jgi:hypothetical protein
VRPGRSLVWLAALALAVLAAWALPELAASRARALTLDLGPNDGAYLQGFRSEWERDGATTFRWASPAAFVKLPLAIEGTGQVLRLRLRRHFTDPAHVRVRLGGRTEAEFDIQADPTVAYRVVEIPLAERSEPEQLVISLESQSATARPLAVAVDWIDVSRGPVGRFHLRLRTRLLLAIAALAAGAFVALAGSPAGGLNLALATSAGAGWLGYLDPLSLERVAANGLGSWIAAGLLGLLAVRTPLGRRMQGLEQPSAALLAVVFAAVGLRLVLLLDVHAWYPDVGVHGLFASRLATRGLGRFLDTFIESQFRDSLGLQLERGHWYAFPYPPAFYLLAGSLVRWLAQTGEVAVRVVGGLANGLEPLVVYAIARRLGQGHPSALRAAAFAAALPLFFVRLSLAYFPALLGHLVDGLVILACLDRLERADRPRSILVLAGVLALALLSYTQSVVNFAVLLTLYAALRLARPGRRAAAREVAGLAAACLLAGGLAFGAFYHRYIPSIVAWHSGAPVAEEQVLLDKVELRARIGAFGVAEEESDPYAGTDVDPIRGLRKGAHRAGVFFGPFAWALLPGIWLLTRGTEGRRRDLLLAWAAAYLAFNLGSAGLPNPNLLRYNKDLEFVAPLACAGLAAVSAWLGRRWAVVGAGFDVAFVGYGLWRAHEALVSIRFTAS